MRSTHSSVKIVDHENLCIGNRTVQIPSLAAFLFVDCRAPRVILETGPSAVTLTLVHRLVLETVQINCDSTGRSALIARPMSESTHAQTHAYCDDVYQEIAYPSMAARNPELSNFKS